MHKMALPSFMQHLQVLEASGLVRSKKVGRVRICECIREPLLQAELWLSQQRKLWEQRLDQLDNFLKE